MPSFISENESILAEKPNYYALSKKSSQPTEETYSTQRTDNFIKRFSQQLTIDAHRKNVVDSSKKRNSMGDHGVIGSRFSKNK